MAVFSGGDTPASSPASTPDLSPRDVSASAPAQAAKPAEQQDSSEEEAEAAPAQKATPQEAKSAPSTESSSHLPPEAASKKSPSKLDIEWVRMMSIQGLSSSESEGDDGPPQLFTSPIFYDEEHMPAASSQQFSVDDLLQEAQQACGTLISGNKGLKEKREDIARNKDEHIAADISIPNFHPKRPTKKKRVKGKQQEEEEPDDSGVSMTRTPKRKCKGKPEGSTQKEPQHKKPQQKRKEHPAPEAAAPAQEAAAPAPEAVAAPAAEQGAPSKDGPIKYAVLRNAYNLTGKGCRRTYLQGKCHKDQKWFLVAECMEKQCLGHREVMEQVGCACVTLSFLLLMLQVL